MNIALVEGLGLPFSFASTYIYDELIPKLNGPYTLFRYTWLNVPADLSMYGLVIGHSFGAAKICGMGRAKLPSKIVTIDPRWTGFDQFNVEGFGWTNFYERDWLFNLPGCSVFGATNQLVTGYSHVQMPGYPPIATLINGLLK